MSETKIYVVMGSEGDYSDRIEWTVVAYRDEELAKAHVLAAEQHARAQAEAHDEPDYDTDEWRCSPDAMLPWDPEFNTEYESWSNLRGIRYWYAEVLLADELPSPSLPSTPDTGAEE